MSIRITVDVENLSGSISDDTFIGPLVPLLELLEQHKTKATFFVVGTLSSLWREPLLLLSKSGHEIGLHGHTHEHLGSLGPRKFGDSLIEGREALENVIGKEVKGFRAPYFSLTKQSQWAHEILFNSGFQFSSSVLPAWNPQAGFATAPKHPFIWSSGLVEFPVPTFGLGRFGIPLLGGAYLRLIPKPVFKIAKLIGSNRPGEWSYCHPYDFDVAAKFETIRESSWIFSKLLFMRRNLMLNRVGELLQLGRSDSFEQQISEKGFIDSLERFEPRKG